MEDDTQGNVEGTQGNVDDTQGNVGDTQGNVGDTQGNIDGTSVDSRNETDSKSSMNFYGFNISYKYSAPLFLIMILLIPFLEVLYSLLMITFTTINVDKSNPSIDVDNDNLKTKIDYVNNLKSRMLKDSSLKYIDIDNVSGYFCDPMRPSKNDSKYCYQSNINYPKGKEHENADIIDAVNKSPICNIEGSQTNKYKYYYSKSINVNDTPKDITFVGCQCQEGYTLQSDGPGNPYICKPTTCMNSILNASDSITIDNCYSVISAPDIKNNCSGTYYDKQLIENYCCPRFLKQAKSSSTNGDLRYGYGNIKEIIRDKNASWNSTKYSESYLKTLEGGSQINISNKYDMFTSASFNGHDLNCRIPIWFNEHYRDEESSRIDNSINNVTRSIYGNSPISDVYGNDGKTSLDAGSKKLQ